MAVESFPFTVSAAGDYSLTLAGIDQLEMMTGARRYAREEGIKVGLFRPITLWPFPADALSATCDHAKAFLSVEMNMGQMVDDVRLPVNGAAPVEFFGRTGGVIPSPAEVLEKIVEINGKVGA